MRVQGNKGFMKLLPLAQPLAVLLEVKEHIQQRSHGPGLHGAAIHTLHPVFVGQLWQALPGRVTQSLGVGTQYTVDEGECVHRFLSIAVGKLEPGPEEIAQQPQPLL